MRKQKFQLNGSVKNFFESINFDKFKDELPKIHSMINDFDVEEKCDLFCAIVDKVNLSIYSKDLLDLVMELDISTDDDDYDYFEDAFRFFYYRVAEQGLMTEKFPEFIKSFKNLIHRRDCFEIFEFMMRRISTKQHHIDVSEYFGFIESTFYRLLDKYYKYDFDYNYKSGIFDHMLNIASSIDSVMEEPIDFERIDIQPPSQPRLMTKLIQKWIPHYPELMSHISGEQGYTAMDSYGYSILLSLIGILENKPLSVIPFGELLFVLNKFLDAFYEISRDENAYSAFRILYNALMSKQPQKVIEIISNKFSLLENNLSSMKKRFPEIWEIYANIWRDSWFL